ncbi:efflux RND transporter periplasmic adaptor subunit [Nitrincola alkalilacustris]|uniref:efflux RND transporter periplasmic adaptor subunit n=1 Tax=Nitrincola alkalilacustris TaxID=1571224 RepID=UPI0014569705|nr:efflux RND transporter periplasmic adaptor subunit [Nitrincola alkalilacustris]
MQHPVLKRLHRASSVLTALILFVLLALWLSSGTIQQANSVAPEAPEVTEATLLRVETQLFTAQPYHPELVAQGQIQPSRSSLITSQISGTLDRIAVEQGRSVSAGTLLIQLAEENRPAEVAKAEANLKLRESELSSGQRLRRDNLLSETELLRLNAAAKTASAELALARQQLAHTRIEAPFSGIIDELPVEQGDHVQAGQMLMRMVDIDTVKLTAQIPQQQVADLTPGLDVMVTLLNGEQLKGKLTFIASMADSSTRSFRIEASIENPDRLRVAGASATVRISLPRQQAHRISPALLALNHDGLPGLYAVDEEQRVRFMPLRLLSIDNTGAWAGGLPNELEVITLGAGFASEGEQVEAIRRSGESS